VALNVLVVGSGGREHALVWKLARSPLLGELHAAPGNPGIAALARCHPVAVGDVDGLVALCGRQAIDLVVVGPEAPLVAGAADALRAAGIAVFGPSAAAARIEGSKSFAKEVMQAAGVPTAPELDAPRAPCVIKADGLASGKGAFVCHTQAEADAAWPRARAFGGPVVVEELLEGEEVSLLALAAGTDAIALPPAQDFKRLLEGDRGPNTGGMGSYAPVAHLAEPEVEELVERIHRPVLRELASRGTPFTGVLYAGLMLTPEGPRVLEFNCRFGDPETQALVPILPGDLLAALKAAATGSVLGVELAPPTGAAVTVVLVAAGYPDAPAHGVEIAGLDDAEALGAAVFHAGTAVRNGKLVTAGGRVLNVTAVGDSLADARERAYAAARLVHFPGARYRRDVAAETLRVAA
jgi:phosphoribosylamine--glycine ligase